MSHIKKEAPWADIIIALMLVGIALICLLPILHVLARSFSSEAAITAGHVKLLPRDFSLDPYKVVLQSKDMIGSLIFTIYLTLLGTTINVVVTALGAYPLSRKDLPGRKFIWYMILLTMFFSGGLIPLFLVVRGLGLLDTVWALILPGTISTFNLILMKTFFQGLPDSLIESAHMDGCPEMVTLFRIILPLSTPIIATLTLFYGVGHWNQYFSALIYISDPSRFPLQLMLQRIIGDDGTNIASDTYKIVPVQGIKSASVFFVIFPVLIVFPFLQRYFTKGALLGSLKE